MPTQITRLQHWQIMLMVNDIRLNFDKGKGTLGEVTRRVLDILDLEYTPPEEEDTL